MLRIEILVPLVWLLVVAVVIAVCSMSAHGDRGEAATPVGGEWIETGALGLSAPELEAQGGPGQEEAREALARELSWA